MKKPLIGVYRRSEGTIMVTIDGNHAIEWLPIRDKDGKVTGDLPEGMTLRGDVFIEVEKFYKEFYGVWIRHNVLVKTW